MHVLNTCKFIKGCINSNREKVETLILSSSRAAYPAVGLKILTKFELIQAFMHVLIICKYHKDWIINSREKWRQRFSDCKSMRIFSHAHGQLTLQLIVGSDRISNSFEISCMSALPASIKKIG